VILFYQDVKKLRGSFDVVYCNFKSGGVQDDLPNHKIIWCIHSL